MLAVRLNSPQGLTKHPGFNLGFALGLGTLLLVLGGALGFRAAMVHRTIAARNSVETTMSPSELGRGFAPVATQVEPAVVNINTEQVVHTTGAPLGDAFSEFFGSDIPSGSFFRQIPRDLKQKSLGSGFVVEPDGYILTNDHVVENASKIKVKLSDGRITDATVVETDPKTDLAVLKIRASNLPALHLAKSDQVQVGDWVLACGSPFGLDQTMAAGILSAKGRVIGTGPYDNFLQTDAAINPGNSGGPLVNLKGEVVGINTMIASRSGGFQGVGFAIPSSMAEDVYHQITKSGKVARAWLGIHAQEVTPEIAKSFNLGEQKGVLVADVDPASPAARGGLESGDIILEFNGQEIHNMHELSLSVAAARVGSPSKMKVLRNDQTSSLSVIIRERPSDISENSRSTRIDEAGKVGITVESITTDTQHQLNLLSTRGALITEVKPGSAADEGGVQQGDVIHEVNHVPVNRASDLQAVTRSLKGGNTVLLKIERQGQTLFLAFELQ
jgi:serine protease Do